MQDKLNALCEELSGKIILDGMLCKAKSEDMIPVINPANGSEIGQIANCNSDDLNAAVLSSKAAQQAWNAMSARARGKLVRKCGDIIAQHKDMLAALMSYETGKAIRTESIVELSVISDTFEFYAGLASELKGETIPFDPNMLTFTIREPFGVIGAIIPWNVPLMLMAMKVAPALVSGNAIVLKASPEASLVVLKAVELMNSVLPKGVLNVITGAAETGKLLVSHPQIRKITFTGSVESGRHVYKSAAEKIIPVTLELGGKSPMIVCADANLDGAVLSVYEGMRFTRQGQSCSAASRVFLHESIHDSFIEKLVSLLRTKIIGDPMDEKTDIGALISKRQYERVLGFVELAKADKSLALHYGPELPADSALNGGYFVRPMIISGLSNSHRLCQEEIFGPICTIQKWTDFDSVISDANAVEFGLAAGIWTSDIGCAMSAAKQLDAGFVQVNQYIVFRPAIPFGGFKSSGIGKEGSLSSMIEHFTKEKTIIIKH